MHTNTTNDISKRLVTHTDTHHTHHTLVGTSVEPAILTSGPINLNGLLVQECDSITGYSSLLAALFDTSQVSFLKKKKVDFFHTLFSVPPVPSTHLHIILHTIFRFSPSNFFSSLLPAYLVFLAYLLLLYIWVSNTQGQSLATHLLTILWDPHDWAT